MRSISTKLGPCPVCGYPVEVYDFNICPSCGVEFGVDTISHSYDELRTIWVENGALWSSSVDPIPNGWDAYRQLIESGHGDAVPLVRPPKPHVVSGMANLSPTPIFIVHAK